MKIKEGLDISLFLQAKSQTQTHLGFGTPELFK
jgi:hypothetical protein